MSILGTLTGIGPATAVVRAQGQSIAGSAGRIAALAKAVATPPRAVPQTGPADPRQRFEWQARQRGYADKAGYERIQKRLWSIWARYIVAAIVLLSVGIAVAPHAYGWLLIVPGPLACLTISIRPAFWQYQLRQRAALPFAAFARRPSEWVPIPEPLSVSGATKITGILIALSLIPASAWAQSYIPASTTSNLALTMLNVLIPIGTGNGLSSMIEVMIASFMFCASCMLAYHIIVGLVASAHDGVVALGMHTFWSPLQVFFGFAMLAPISGHGGLDGMQIAVYEIGKASLSTADDMWNVLVDSLLPSSGSDTQNSGYISSDMLGALTIARQVADLEICSAVHTLEDDTIDAPAPAVSGETGTDSIAWDYGSCGSMTMPLASVAPAEAENTSSAEMQAMQKATTDYQTARHAALTDLVTSIRKDSTIAEMEKGSVPNSGTWPATVSAAVESLSGYATTYDTAMQAAATAYLGTRDADVYSKLKTDAAALGWMSAGSYWRTLAQVGDNLSQLQSASPDFGHQDGDNYLSVSIPTDRDAARAVKRFDLAWAQATAKTRLTAADLSAGGNRSGDTLTRIVAPMEATLAPAVINLADANANDPEATFISLGHNLILASTVGITAGTIISAATDNAAGKFFGAGGAWDWLSGFAKLPIEFCFVLGMFLAYVLPMLPFIAVLWLIMGWVTLTLEALIAAPLYSLLFIRCDGRELVGGVQTPGFVILFNLFLYPCLGVAGLGAAFFALPQLSNFLLSQYADAFVGQQSGHITGFFALLTGIGMLTWLQFTLVLKTLELVSSLPSTIPRWLGSSLGGSADGITESSNRIYAGVSNTSSRAMSVPAKSVPRPPKLPGQPGGGGNGVGGLGGGEDGGNAVAASDKGSSGGQGGGGGSVAPRMGGGMRLSGVDEE